MGVHLELDNKPIKVIGGVIVTTNRNNKIYNNTLDGRLAKLRSSKEAEIGKIIGVI